VSRDVVKAQFEESVRVKRKFLDEYEEATAHAAEMLVRSLRAGGKILLFGNGGSAADAQHIAAELVGRFSRQRDGLPAIALTTDTSALTAIANDFGYEEIFARQVRALGRTGDVAIAISTSGRSPSVLRAVEACKAIGMPIIGLSGGNGGLLAGAVDLSLVVTASTDSARIQETHITIGHVLCDLVDSAFAGGRP